MIPEGKVVENYSFNLKGVQYVAVYGDDIHDCERCSMKNGCTTLILHLNCIVDDRADGKPVYFVRISN